MALHYQESEPILVGSGELYLGKIDGDPETVDEATIEAVLVNVGAIESSAKLIYSNDIKEVESANRGTITSFITKQTVEFDCGVMTWRMEGLELLSPGIVETDQETGAKKLKIGQRTTLPVNYLRFVHAKRDNSGKLIINMYRATPSAGFELTFDKENPLSVGYKFKGLATPTGNIIEIIETFEGSATPVLTSIACIPNKMTLSSGETGQINILGIYNDDFYNQVNNPAGTTFESDSVVVATVDATGLVSYVATGTAIITATNGTLTDTCVVTCI